MNATASRSKAAVASMALPVHCRHMWQWHRTENFAEHRLVVEKAALGLEVKDFRRGLNDARRQLQLVDVFRSGTNSPNPLRVRSVLGIPQSTQEKASKSLAIS